LDPQPLRFDLLPHGAPSVRDEPRRRPRFRWLLVVALFVVSLVTTTTLGCSWSLLTRTDVVTDLAPLLTLGTLRRVWSDPELLGLGLRFSLPALAILLCHELGHWFACRHHRLDATPPYFLPAPVGLGTFGAFIRIRSAIRGKRELLDVGVSGPIAGFLALLPVLALGVAWSTPSRLPTSPAGGVELLLYRPGSSLLLAGLTRYFHGPLPTGWVLNPHPFLLAGWVGLFATMLNLLPLAQLDGGHIVYAALGRWQRRLAWPLWFGLLLLGFRWPGWWLWSAIVLLLGVRHPRVVDEALPLDPRRRWLAFAALAIFVLSFMPAPIELETLGPPPGSGGGQQVEYQRDGAVVDQLDAHLGAESALLHGHAELPQPLGDPLDQRLGDLRPRGADERGASPLVERRQQGELRHEQHGATHLAEIPVEVPLRVAEDPQAGDLLGRSDRFLGPVAGLDAGEHQQAGTDRRDALVVHLDRGARHALQDESHGWRLSSSEVEHRAAMIAIGKETTTC